MNKTGNYQVHEAMTGSSPKPKRIECSNEAPPIDITQNMEKAEKTSSTTLHKKSNTSQRKKPASTRKTSRKTRAAAASGISRLDEIGYNHSVV